MHSSTYSLSSTSMSTKTLHQQNSSTTQSWHPSARPWPRKSKQASQVLLEVWICSHWTVIMMMILFIMRTTTTKNHSLATSVVTSLLDSAVPFLPKARRLYRLFVPCIYRRPPKNTKRKQACMIFQMTLLLSLAAPFLPKVRMSLSLFLVCILLLLTTIMIVWQLSAQWRKQKTKEEITYSSVS